MNVIRKTTRLSCVIAFVFTMIPGCVSQRPPRDSVAFAGQPNTSRLQASPNPESIHPDQPTATLSPPPTSARKVTLAAHQTPITDDAEVAPGVPLPADSIATDLPESAQGSLPPADDASEADLHQLEMIALASNPMLRRLQQEYQAARAKVRYIDELPDPTIGTNAFVNPIETAAGSQRANLTVTQMLPWLPRLNALEQQACFEAMALNQTIAAERLKLVADIRTMWYRLYVIEKQIEINEANQELLQALIEVANARVSTGNASQSDLLSGTVEYSKLEETLIGLRQQRVSTRAQLNRLIGRDASTPIPSPQHLDASLPVGEFELLRDVAFANQPEIESARIRATASYWGIEVARLKRRPDFSLSASWFAMDDNRPPSTVVDVGRDAWSLGAMMSIPLRFEKYDAIEQESRWKHAAAHSSVEQVSQRYEALLLDLLEQANAADETRRLYRDTIIPEARRTLNADQSSYANGDVEFDRVLQNFRNLLTLEQGFHRATGQLATSVARIEQATGAAWSEAVAY